MMQDTQNPYLEVERRLFSWAVQGCGLGRRDVRGERKASSAKEESISSSQYFSSRAVLVAGRLFSCRLGFSVCSVRVCTFSLRRAPWGAGADYRCVRNTPIRLCKFTISRFPKFTVLGVLQFLEFSSFRICFNVLYIFVFYSF